MLVMAHDAKAREGIEEYLVGEGLRLDRQEMQNTIDHIMFDIDEIIELVKAEAR